MYGAIKSHLENELEAIREAGLFKEERIITSPQGPVIRISTGQEVLNFCANNYLGLSSHPEVIQAAKDTLDSHGFGMSSVRFICGTQDIHKELEHTIARFYGTEDTILYAAAFDANGGVFEPLLGPEDAIISDALNHASIIDGVRLCKANATAMPTETWATWNNSCSRQMPTGLGLSSSLPTAYSPWTAWWLPLTRSATWPGHTTPW